MKVAIETRLLTCGNDWWSKADWAALERKPNQRPSRQRVCDGESAAKLIALRCGEPPAGQARWTLRLLADKAVELEIVPAISHETVRQVLKKTN